jgi:hypothetical protein
VTSAAGGAAATIAGRGPSVPSPPSAADTDLIAPMISIGIGKMIVELFSAEISVMVCS